MMMLMTAGEGGVGTPKSKIQTPKLNPQNP